MVVIVVSVFTVLKEPRAMGEKKEVIKMRINEIKHQWKCYLETKEKSLLPEDLKILKEQAKKYGVKLNGSL